VIETRFAENGKGFGKPSTLQTKHSTHKPMKDDDIFAPTYTDADKNPPNLSFEVEILPRKGSIGQKPACIGANKLIL